MEEKFNVFVPVKKNPCGKLVGYHQRQIIINLYISKMTAQAKHPNKRRLKYIELIKFISQETGIGQRTISKTLSEYKRKGTISSPNRKKVRPKGDIVCWRQKYLESIRYYRSHGRQIYYLDESWINVEESAKSVDSTIQSGQKNLSGKGKQLTVVHIGSSDGFVAGGLWAFESKNNSSDYHDEINDVTFYEWFKGIISLLEDNAVIVMDTASYHSAKKDMFPLISWGNGKIIKWLENKGKLIHRPMVKHQLLEEAEQFRPVCEKYVIDELAKENNKIVLRLPPYHSELNPIELAWSFVKRYVKTNNMTFKLPDVQKLLHEGVELVTPQMWKKFINHVIKKEDKFFEIDFITDELLEAELEEPNASHSQTIKCEVSDSEAEFDYL
ncbi:uncharacterized protein LOC132938975 [Metopolophium dirhodum]|uniref:uncharacterized protein LOC132938975 n=1 Tax=Metopolophium dirhodum TaxID=44670 RepID=UPI00298FE578|nr:uncharacterized protein LOC132938975 [Metopolophium dirhodum]